MNLLTGNRSRSSAGLAQGRARLPVSDHIVGSVHLRHHFEQTPTNFSLKKGRDQNVRCFDQQTSNLAMKTKRQPSPSVR